MIYGIGTDIVDIRRIAQTLARQPRFAQRILGAQELAVFERRRSSHPARGLTYLATRFSCKEAFSKACGLGMRSPMTWQAIEILNQPGGRPAIVAHGAMREWLVSRGLCAHVTLSDERDYAVSFVVLESASPAAHPGINTNTSP
ncbi:MAG TPA: holo-ACP synthase [Burkholderiaceae bacterium]|nr:holo-ACP synthase [Burkholderiaceae bacterium]